MRQPIFLATVVSATIAAGCLAPALTVGRAPFTIATGRGGCVSPRRKRDLLNLQSRGGASLDALPGGDLGRVGGETA